PSDVADRSAGSSIVHIVVSMFSDRPYRLRTWQPNISRAFSTTDPGIGAPAQIHTRRLLGSCLPGSKAAINICRNAVAVTAQVQPCSLIRSRPTAGSQTSIRYDEAPCSSGNRTLVMIPVLCVIGDGPNCTSCSL